MGDYEVRTGYDQKTCLFCGELIQSAARKCRYCGELLDPALIEAREAKRIALSRTYGPIITNNVSTAASSSSAATAVATGIPWWRRSVMWAFTCSVFWAIFGIVLIASAFSAHTPGIPPDVSTAFMGLIGVVSLFVFAPYCLILSAIRAICGGYFWLDRV